MNTPSTDQPGPSQGRTTVERTSDRELTVTRTLHAPPRRVYEAWARAELFRRWWVPRSFGMELLSCELDVRVGGTYRLVFAASPEPMAFHGRYLEVVPQARIVWTNEEAGDNGQVTTVTFEATQDGGTLLVMHERYPSKEALDEGAGGAAAMEETFNQLDEVLAQPLQGGATAAP